MMAPWIEDKWQYIKPDVEIADLLASRAHMDDMYAILGEREKYSLDDARALHKLQYSKAQYIALMDLPLGYSPAQMLEIYRDRVRYLILRGSTLNNPHIPGSYFSDWHTQIGEDHAASLRTFVEMAVAGLL